MRVATRIEHLPLAALALAAALAAPQARADGPPPPAGAPAPPAAEADRPQPQTPFDFDLLPAAPAPTAADRAFEQAVGRRRTMLTFHQGLGVATWTAVAATTLVGQLDFNDRFRGGGDTGRYHGAHKALAYGSAALFTTAAAFALLAPSPYEKGTRRALDTAKLHKVAMGVAAAGMLAQVVLGVAARRQAGSLRERDLATAHQAIGYATLGAATAGAVVLLF